MVLIQNGIKEDDFVVFVLGEIDVRCHLGIQRDKYNRDENEIIETLTENYLLSILESKQDIMNINFIFCSVVPPTDTSYNPAFPFYGTLEDRIVFTKNMNRVLKNKCKLNNLGFLDIYDYYSLENGVLNPEICYDFIHIHPNHNNEIKKCLMDYINNPDLKREDSKKRENDFIKKGITKVKFNDIVTMHVTWKLEDGTLLDNLNNLNPLQITIGENKYGYVLERNIIGMYLGESKEFTELADKVFSCRRDLIFQLNRKEFSMQFKMKPEVGQQVCIDNGGNVLTCRVINCSEETVTFDANPPLDVNHPLAGKKLIIKIHIINIA